MITIDKNIILLLDLVFNKVYDKVAILTISLLALAILLRAIFLSINGGSVIQNIKELALIVLIIMAAPSLFTLTENVFKEITYKILEDKKTEIKMIYDSKPKTFIGFIDEYTYKSSGEKIVEAIETWLVEVSYWVYGLGYALAMVFFPIVAVLSFVISMSLLRFITVLIITFQSLPMTWSVLAYLRSYVLHMSDTSFKASITTGLITIISMFLSYFTYKIAFLGTSVLGNITSHMGSAQGLINPISSQLRLGHKAKGYAQKFEDVRIEKDIQKAKANEANSLKSVGNLVGADRPKVLMIKEPNRFTTPSKSSFHKNANNPEIKTPKVTPKKTYLCEAHQPYKRPKEETIVNDEKVNIERAKAFKAFDMEGELK